MLDDDVTADDQSGGVAHFEKVERRTREAVSAILKYDHPPSDHDMTGDDMVEKRKFVMGMCDLNGHLPQPLASGRKNNHS